MAFTNRLFNHWQWLIVALVVLVLVNPAPAAQTWQQLSPTPDPVYGSPAGRYTHTAVYNPATNRMIIFAGSTASGGYGIVNDVWVLTQADGTGGAPAWLKLNPAVGPGPRCMQTAVYDQASNRMIIHGGHTLPGYCEGVVGDTWILTNADGTESGAPTWIRLTTTGAVPVKRYATAAYDAINNRMILWGGPPAGCGPAQDTYFVLTNANGLGGTAAWSQLSPANPITYYWFENGPAGYDPGTNTFTALARDEDSPDYYNATRVLSSANGLGSTPAWTDLTFTGPTPTLFAPKGVYDPGRNSLLISCGSSDGQWTSETWRLDYANGQGGTPAWTKLTPGGALPPGRYGSTAVYNPTTDRLIIFGGCLYGNPPFYNDVWVLTEAMGAVPPPPNQPPTANAGDNRSITSDLVNATIIQGTASDPDQDSLQYRWLEGTTVLSDWQGVGSSGAAPLNLNSLGLTIGTHTLTLEVSDGKAVAADEMLLTIDNTAPQAAPSGGGTYQVHTPITLGGQVADYDGDQLSYQWLEGGGVLGDGTVATNPGGEPVNLNPCVISGLTMGDHTITLSVSDGVNSPVTAPILVQVIDTNAPTLAPVADKTILWPPDHQMVDVTIRANASDDSGMPVTLTAVVSCNEAEEGVVYWTEPTIDQVTGIISLQLLSERLGKSSGRVYTITITAKDGSNNATTAEVMIRVPHDKGK